MPREVATGGGRPDRYRDARGRVVPSVTTILDRFKDSGGLIKWAHRCGLEGRDMTRERDSAASAGSICHAWVEDVTHGRERRSFDLVAPEIIERAAAGFDAFLEWRASNNVTIEHTETPLVDSGMGFAGTFDAIGVVNGERVLIDYKTSRRVYPEHAYQLAAYRHLVRSEMGLMIDSAILVRLDKETAEPDVHWFSPVVLDRAWDGFALMRSLYEVVKNVESIVRKETSNDRS